VGTGGPLPHNTCRKQPRGARFTVTLPKETELEDLVNWMMSITCQKFIWDRKVRSGKVTILSPEPVTVDEAYAAFYAALETMGLTVEPSGKYFKIVETTDAKNRTLPLYGDDANAPNSDRFVTQLIRIKNGHQGHQRRLDAAQEQAGQRRRHRQPHHPHRQGLEHPPPRADRPRARHPDRQREDLLLPAAVRQGRGGRADHPRHLRRGQQAAVSRGPGQGQGRRASSPTASAINRVIVDERSGTLIVITNEADYVIIRA
jgi:general secretion pathway protein D